MCPLQKSRLKQANDRFSWENIDIYLFTILPVEGLSSQFEVVLTTQRSIIEVFFTGFQLFFAIKNDATSTTKKSEAHVLQRFYDFDFKIYRHLIDAAFFAPESPLPCEPFRLLKY